LPLSFAGGKPGTNMPWSNSNDSSVIKELGPSAKDAIKFVETSESILTDKNKKIIHDCL
jgi:hypothetical protein